MFTQADVVGMLGSDGIARVAVSELRKLGLAYLFSSLNKKRLYRLADPSILPYLSAGRLRNLNLIPQGKYAKLAGIFAVEAIQTNPEIESVIVYGSTSRGSAQPGSDVDVLLLLADSKQSVGERIRKFSKLEEQGAVSKELDWLDGQGVYTHLSLLPLTVKEAAEGPPILLDIVEDGIPIIDDGEFQTLRDALKYSFKKLDVKREYLSPNEWYWTLPREFEIQKTEMA